MDWIQFSIFIITTFGLFIWNRAESRADVRHLDARLQANSNLIMEVHKESHTLINAIREDANIFREKWAEESKEFHGKLCQIEERSRK